MTAQESFLNRMRALAKLCNFALDATIISLYEMGLQPYGLENASRAIEQLIFSRRDREPFPSVRSIVELIMPSTNDEFEAIEAAARIIQSVSKFGYSGASEARKFMGELGWRIVERFGGWMTVCETMNSDNIGILHAQFRQLAKSQIHRAKVGMDNIAPVIPLNQSFANRGLLQASNALKNLFPADDEPLGSA